MDSTLSGFCEPILSAAQLLSTMKKQTTHFY